MARHVGDGIVSVEADLQNCYAMLDGLYYNRRTVTKRILSAAATGGRQAIRKHYRNVLNKRSGTLYKSITSYVYRNNSRIVFTNNAESDKPTSKRGRLARYGFMLAAGYTIKPKKMKALSWVQGGQRFFAKSVTVHPKDWFEPPVDMYFMSQDCENRMEQAAQKQVDYWTKRAEEGR